MKASATTQELRPWRPVFTTPRGLPAIICTIVALALWQASVALFDVPAYVIPAPATVAARIYEDLVSGLILPHFWIKFVEVIVGFAMAVVLGMGLGVTIGLSPAIDRAIYPLLLAFQTIPKVAIAPLLIIWFGYGLHSKAVMAALIAFFPILVNVIAGLRTTDQRPAVADEIAARAPAAGLHESPAAGDAALSLRGP